MDDTTVSSLPNNINVISDKKTILNKITPILYIILGPDFRALKKNLQDWKNALIFAMLNQREKGLRPYSLQPLFNTANFNPRANS